MDPASEDTCCYCLGSTDGRPYHHVMWKSYKMCLRCKTDLKNCLSCERKIKEKTSSRRYTPCCRSTYDHLCDICCELPIICCKKKLGDAIPEVLYALDLHMSIRVPPNFLTYQNIYTFNKERFNDANHRCTFEYDHVGYAHRGERVDSVEPAQHSEVAAKGRDPPNGKNGKATTEGDFKSEQNQKKDIKTLLRKLTRSGHRPKKKKKKREVTRTGEDTQRVSFSRPQKKDNKENNKVEGGRSGGDALMCAAKGEGSAPHDVASPIKVPPTEGINQPDETHRRRREPKNHHLKKKLFSKKSSLYSKATAPLLDYLKLLRSRTKERGRDRRGGVSRRQGGAPLEEQKGNTTADVKNEKRLAMRFSTRFSTRFPTRFSTRIASRIATRMATRIGSKAVTQVDGQMAAAPPRKSHDLHLVLSFTNRANEEEIFTRLLHNELKVTDVLYLRNMFRQNGDGEKAIASCNCVVVSQKKLLLLHEQNKMIPNYAYRKLKLHELLPPNKDHLKLVDHLSLADCLPEISLFFYMSHELMHTYLWVSHLGTSAQFEQIRKIVKKLHGRSFHAGSENNRGDKLHKRLAYYLSPELEEALCVFASIQFMHHMRAVNAGGCESGHPQFFGGEHSHAPECELINYYIRTCERGGSPMYGKNYRELKRIMKNYTLVDILHIIGDINRARFYPVVSLRLLRAVVSSIRVVR
ncbi:hypothetical protein, conserved [Plasmodium vivax]|uniref:Uncharacterized protein n=1 Tax=Plasmodium vivax (strain Salvador I) TaxID=126793 RepID=A5K7X7_PLAVS|nr:hypothetical protein, conserved [Plasmodium vivax]EDL44391.1 hypothetical protein, conserved [Plasmodium vivax]|eukprot:XP_001614118.1 hypothetical protein [Plasmodium vivax Sal-1]